MEAKPEEIILAPDELQTLLEAEVALGNLPEALVREILKLREKQGDGDE